jgi:hypothetical protein
VEDKGEAELDALIRDAETGAVGGE